MLHRRRCSGTPVCNTGKKQMIGESLPLFPLSTVLFPGIPLTLHIFEAHYRLMIGHCINEGLPFGVVLLRHGREVGTPAQTHDVGTVAAINANVRMEDGRFLIATVGQQRFRIIQTLQTSPYITAEVEPILDDQPLDDPVQQRLHTAYDRYWRAVATATGVQRNVEPLPEDGLAMSYYLAHRMRVTNLRKQRWLEVGADVRSREMASMLMAEMSLLPQPTDNQAQPSDEEHWSWSWN